MSNTDFEDEGQLPYRDPFDDQAVTRTVGSLEESPDDAARAIELGKKTGANPVAIHADLEEFENNAKAATTAQLIRGNRQISDYINSHPLAGIVSNGDLNKLDDASGKMKALPKGKSPVEKDFGETVGSLAVQWGWDLGEALWESGKSLASIPKDIGKHTIPSDEVRQAAEQIRKNGPDFHNISQFLGTLNNLFVTQIASGDPLNPAAQYKPIDLGAQDLVGGLVGAFGAVTGITPTVKAFARVGEDITTVPAEFSEQVAMLGMMFMGLRHGKSHVKAGEIPPPGLSKETDGIREHRSKENLRALDEATKSVQSTATSQLAPDLAKEFAGQHVENRSVYVNVDAVRRLYGDKLPAKEDGILGWVEGLGEQISAQAEVGGDVAIPLKDWLTKVDPEIAKILHDDTKVLRDDTTVNDAKRLKGEEPTVTTVKDGELVKEDAETEALINKLRENWTPYKEDKPPGLRPIDMTRRGFLKGVGATVATAATGKVPKLTEANPFAGADLSAFAKNVEYEAAKFYEWYDYMFGEGFSGRIYGEKARDDKTRVEDIKQRTIKHMKDNLAFEHAEGDPSGRAKVLETAIKQMESGWMPSREAILQARQTANEINFGVAEQSAPKPKEENVKKLAEQGADPDVVKEITSLPWPEEYMKDGYPKGITEPGPRQAMRDYQTAIDETRDAARLRPIIDQGKIELQFETKYPPEEFKADENGQGPMGIGETHDFNITKDGKPAGYVSVTPLGDLLHVDYTGTGKDPWSSGMSGMLDAMAAARELKIAFPETTKIGGWRERPDGSREYVVRNFDELGIHNILSGKDAAPDFVEREKIPQVVKDVGKPSKITVQTVGEKRFTAETAASTTISDLFKQINFDVGIGGPIRGSLNFVRDEIIKKVGHVGIHFIDEAQWKVITDNNPRADAFYDPINNLIMVAKRELTSSTFHHTVFHESLHAATTRALMFDKSFEDRIIAISQHIKLAEGETHYGLTDAHEFIAEAFTNPKFQKLLMDTPIPPELAEKLGVKPGTVRTIWDSIIQAIAKFFGRDADANFVSALEATIRVGSDAMQRTFTLAERRRMVGYQREFAQYPEARLHPMVSSMKQLELVRSLARLEDEMLKQVGQGYSIRDIRGALSDLDAVGEHAAKENMYNKQILERIDMDDAKNYMEYINNITSEAKSSLSEFQDIHKGEIEKNLAEQRDAPFKKVFDAIDEMKAMAEKETDAPSIAPGRGDETLPPEAGPTGFTGKLPPGLKPMARQGELDVTRQESKKPFTPTALNINKEWLKKYEDLIAKQQGEDAKKRMEVAVRRAEQIQTKEWRETQDRISKEVEEKVRARPDIAVDEALRKGTLGEGTERPGGRRLRLNAEELTEEQKGILDKSEYSMDGVHPDDLANYFGFVSGDAMLERLGQLREHVKETYASSEAFIKAVVREETTARMEREFGDLGEKILEEARDHITSETQIDLMHEELQGLAMQAGVEITMTKAQMKTVAKTAFDKHVMADLTSAEYLRLAGKHGIELEKAMLADDYKTAFKAKQVQTLAMMMAQEARKVEKAKKVWDRNAKRFAKREVGGIDQRYTNAIHDIMFRTGSTPRPRRTPGDLMESFRLDGWSDVSPLRDFVEDRMEAFRELAVPEWLQDPRFQKDFDSLTSKEFMEAHDAIKSLIKNGRDEQRVFSEGNAADLAEVFEGMREQIKDLPVQEDRIDRPEGRVRQWITTAFWSHVNLESMMNRLDRGDKNGLFKKYIMRPIAEASNAKDAMMKKYQKEVSDLGRIKDMDKLVENTLFIDPRGDGKPFIMRKRNVLGVLQNVGNVSNLEKLAKGYGVEPDAIMQWLKRNTTKEDWDRAQKIGKIFDDLFAQGARMAHELTGVQPVKVPLQPFVDPFGTVREGWYNPVKYDRKRPGNSPRLMGRSALEEDGYFRATVPTGFLTERTGYVAPMELNLDIVPVRMRQMIHDITMRPAIIQASKFFYNPEFNRMVRKQYGDKPVEEFVPFLRDVANSPNFVSYAEQVGNQAMEFFRQNLISTLIGLNPGTVMKHGTTALLNSLQQMGYRDFGREFLGLLRDLPSDRANWRMAMEKSEELQRRRRNFSEIIAGHGVEINIRGGKGGSRFDTLREVLIQFGSTPVAASDLASSVPTWLVAYKRARMEGATEGDAINRGDLAVRQTHGSSVMSNKPSVMRTNAFGALYTSLYGFFSHMFQKQYEMAWKAKDAMGLAKQGEKLEAAKRIPELASLFLSYVILPAIIEELVTPYTNSEKDSWGKKLAKTLAFGVGSSMIGVRDFVHGFINVRDPSAGLVGTMFKTISDVGRDLGRGTQAFTDPARQAKLINHTMTMFGLLTGLTNASEGKMAEYAWRVNKGLEKPKGPWEVSTGMRYGTTKGHSKTIEEYLRHVRGH